MRRMMFLVILFMVTAIQSGRADDKLTPQIENENVEVNEANVIGIWQQIRFVDDEVIILPHLKVYASDHTFNSILIQKKNASGISTTGTWTAEPGYVTETLDADCNNYFAGKVMKLPANLYNKDVMTVSYENPYTKQTITEFWVRIPKFGKEK
jgi:hypothetical protein